MTGAKYPSFGKYNQSIQFNSLQYNPGYKLLALFSLKTDKSLHNSTSLKNLQLFGQIQCLFPKKTQTMNNPPSLDKGDTDPELANPADASISALYRQVAACECKHLKLM